MTRLRGKRLQSGLRMEALYGWLCIARQGFFQAVARQAAEAEMMEQAKGIVARYGKEKGRRAGSRSLPYNLGIKERFGIGVAKSERLMPRYGLALAPLRVRVVATKPVMQSWNYGNLLGGLACLYTGPSLFYVFSLMGLYSSRIVGIWASDRQRAIGAKAALEAWAKLRGPESLAGCIRHTDGGSQYFSELYLKASAGLGALTSVAGSCLEDGHAEQLNGLAKGHFIPTADTQVLHRLRGEVGRVQHSHGFERKQEGLGWRTPAEHEAYVEGLPKDERPVKQLHDFSASPKAA